MAENEKHVLSGLEKANLQSIIADVKFENTKEADLYRCNKCHLIAIYHYMTSCSHVLCGKCHAQYHKQPCPVEYCQNTSIDKITQNVEFEFGMYNLKVYCRFQANGCEIHPKLSNLLVHQSNCQFSTKNLLPRLYVVDPLKKLEEEVLSLKTTINDIAVKVVKELEECKDKIKAMALEMNLMQNPYKATTMQVQLEEEVLILKTTMNDIAVEKGKVSKELEECKDKIKAMALEMNFMQNQYKATTMQVQEMSTGFDKSYEFLWEISSLSKNRSGNTINKDFISSDAKFKITANISNWLGLNYHLFTTCNHNERESNGSLYFHKTTIYISDQNNESMKHVCRIYDPTFTGEITSRNVLKFSPASITNNLNKCDAVIIKIIIEPFLSDYKYRARFKNGILIWKIDNYSNRKQDFKDCKIEAIYSDYFLSSEQGYRMKTVFQYVFHSNIIRIGLIFVKGEFDYSLTKEFPHKVTFSIIDQSDSEKKKHLLKSKSNHKAKESKVDFPSSQLESNAYLKNDCMMIKVTVESI